MYTSLENAIGTDALMPVAAGMMQADIRIAISQLKTELAAMEDNRARQKLGQVIDSLGQTLAEVREAFARHLKQKTNRSTATEDHAVAESR